VLATVGFGDITPVSILLFNDRPCITILLLLYRGDVLYDFWIFCQLYWLLDQYGGIVEKDLREGYEKA